MKRIIYTVGYTSFQMEQIINLNRLFTTLQNYGVQYLVDVRSIPGSSQYPQCNADNLKDTAKQHGIGYVHIPELGAKADPSQDVFSPANQIFHEQLFPDLFPISKSNRPENDELQSSDWIVDFRKFRQSPFFIQGLQRIEKAYSLDFTLCLMCSESVPQNCHRYFLISRALEERYNEWLEIQHIVKTPHNNNYTTLSNTEVNASLIDKVLSKKMFHNIYSSGFLEPAPLDHFNGNTMEEKKQDFFDRYWNLLHGWKRADAQNYGATL